jgi:hypothetical protein
MRKSLAIAAIMLATGARAFDATPLMSFFQPATVDTWVTIPNLLAQWKMNDNAANTTVVETKGNFTGTAQRTTSLLTVAGKINTALVFTNKSDYVTFPTLTNITTLATYALWYHPTNKPNDQVLLGGSYYVMYVLPGAGNLYCHNGVAAQISWIVANTANVWVHYAITQTGNSLTLYVNGITQGGQTLSGGAQKPTFIGRTTSSGGLGIQGYIDDVRIYNNCLASNEVFDIYNAGNGTERE